MNSKLNLNSYLNLTNLVSNTAVSDPASKIQDKVAFLKQLEAWKNEAKGENRDAAFALIAYAYLNVSSELDLSGFGLLTALPILPPWVQQLRLFGCDSLQSLPERLPDGIVILGKRNFFQKPRNGC